MTMIVANGAPLPNTVSGTNPTTYLPGTNGITAGPQPVKLFSTLINVPGSSRLDGDVSRVLLAGNITGGVSTNTQLSLYFNYPTLSTGAPQYPNANITAANCYNTAGTGFALFNSNNNFVIGQYVQLNGMVNTQFAGICGPLSVANSTAFGGFLNGAAVVNASGGATVNTVAAGYASILPFPLYVGQNVGTVINVGQTGAFMGDIRLSGDIGSNVLFSWGVDGVTNYNASSSAFSGFVVGQNIGNNFAVPGINYKNEPIGTLQCGITFGASNASNTAVLKSFYLEN